MIDRDEALSEMGLGPRWRLRRTAPAGSASKPGASEAIRPESAAASTSPVDARERRIAALGWEELIADVSECNACALCRQRTRAVPGVGARGARWMFVGEGPGAEEDLRGEPFVGQAGKLLDNMLAALGLSRTDSVYITNAVKCRPPGNRAPEPGESAACRPYLDRQIDLLAPSLIVALGRSAATTMLGVDASIASLRGRVHRYRDVPLIVTYHPAYLLRNLLDKAKAWEDFCFARATMQRVRRDMPASQ